MAPFAHGGSALSLLFVVFAGCESGGAEPVARTGSDIEAGSDEVEDAGQIEGLIVDEQIQPIVGALAGLKEPPVQAVSDEGGRFRITNLAPGTYQLFVQALGYESIAKSVEVGPSAATEVTITLILLPVVEAYHETFGPWQGYFECRLGTPTQTGECGWVGPADPYTGHPTALYPNDKAIFRWNLSSDDWRTVQGEMRWAPGTLASSKEMRLAFSYEKRPSVHRWCSGEGLSPLMFHLDKEDEFTKCDEVGTNTAAPVPKMKDNPMRTYANLPFGSTTNPFYVAFQQKYEAITVVFYGEPAAEGFVALPE